MISIKRGWLIALVIVALAAGAASMALYTGVDWKNVFSQSGPDRIISAEEYEEYRHLVQAYGKVDSLRRHIESNFYEPVDDEALELGMLRGLFGGLDDPYSYYMTAQEYESVIISLTGEYSGIGVSMSAGADGYIEVIAVTDGSPAAEADVRRGDLIFAVDGIIYTGAEIDIAAAAIRGKSGTNVTLTLLRNGAEIERTIRRKKIVSQTVRWEWLDGDIGYIQINSFEEHTAADFRKALRTLENRKAKGFVLDLRNNPGGLVNACIEVADELMGEAMVVYSEDQQGRRDYYHVKQGQTALPFVILVNEGTASAAEILSAGVQDNDVAPIVGMQTYGKGVIQQLEEWPDGSATNLTIMQYYSPKGNVIHGVGIKPDVEVELLESDYEDDGTLRTDRQLEQAQKLVYEALSGQ